MFCLVEFDGPTKEVAIAHMNWLSGSKCYWPPFWKVSSKYIGALKAGVTPDPNSWSLYDVHVVGGRYFETYDMARRKLNLPQGTLDASELSSIEDQSRLRKRANPEESSDENEEIEITQVAVSTPKAPKRKNRGQPLAQLTKAPTPPPVTTRIETMTTPSQAGQQGPSLIAVANLYDQQQDTGLDGAQNANIIQSRVINVPTSQMTTFAVGELTGFSSVGSPSSQHPQTFETPPRYAMQGIPQQSIGLGYRNDLVSQNGFRLPQGQIDDFRHVQTLSAPVDPSADIYRALSELLQGQALLTAKVDLALDFLRIISMGQNQPSAQSSGQINLTLASLEEADELDTHLKEGNNLKHELIATLANSGGNNPNQITYRIMTTLMTDELMTKFTFAGRNGDHRCFKDTLFLTCICGAVRKQAKGSIASDKDIEKAIEYWLKKAPKRLLKKKSGDPVSERRERDSDEDS